MVCILIDSLKNLSSVNLANANTTNQNKRKSLKLFDINCKFTYNCKVNPISSKHKTFFTNLSEVKHKCHESRSQKIWNHLATACWPGSMYLANFISCHPKWTWGENESWWGVSQDFRNTKFMFIIVKSSIKVPKMLPY